MTLTSKSSAAGAPTAHNLEKNAPAAVAQLGVEATIEHVWRSRGVRPLRAARTRPAW